MSEQDIINSSQKPQTRVTLTRDLRQLGLKNGETLLVHSSLRSLGWVVGGAPVVVQALLEVLGPEGTLMMPAQTTQLTDPAEWAHPQIPEDWLATVRGALPGFDPALTPSYEMGQIAETFRTWPGTQRSEHPHMSFCARGPQADQLLQPHRLDFSLGPDSPLGRFSRVGGRVLLLGVGYDCASILHLAEYAWPGRQPAVFSAPVQKGAEKVWLEYQDIEFDLRDFAATGQAFETESAVDFWSRGRVGQAECRLFSARALVEFAGRHWRLTGRPAPL